MGGCFKASDDFSNHLPLNGFHVRYKLLYNVDIQVYPSAQHASSDVFMASAVDSSVFFALIDCPLLYEQFYSLTKSK